MTNKLHLLEKNEETRIVILRTNEQLEVDFFKLISATSKSYPLICHKTKIFKG